MPRLKFLQIAGLAIFLTGCGSTISTHRQDQPARPIPEGVLSPSQVRQDRKSIGAPLEVVSRPEDLTRWAGEDPLRLIEVATFFLDRAENSRWEEQSGNALAACELAWRSLVASGIPSSRWMTDPLTRRALAISNTALPLFINHHEKTLADGAGSLALSTPLGPVQALPRHTPESRYQAGYFDKVIPADDIWIRGFTQRNRIPGIGTPLVGIRKRTPARKAEMSFQPPRRGIMVPLTAVAEFDLRGEGPAQLKLKFYDLGRTITARIRGHSVPLAGDFTAPLALSFDSLNDLLIGIAALLNIGTSVDYNGIYLTEPFDPDRIPVLLLHGLSSSPLVWRNVATNAMAKPTIRQNYQFWYAFYSTGVPVTKSAALLRTKIAAIRQTYDPAKTCRASRNMVVVGYSMGGVIGRLLATDIGNHFWESFSNRPFDQVDLKPEDRQTLRDWIFWKPATDITEVIFLGTPHQGTRMADANFAQLGRKLIGLPGNLLQFQQRLVLAVADELSGNKLPVRTFTGIDSLSPGAPVYRAFARAPFVAGISTHSIIGDRGRGDTPDSSDGVVGYWSSHLEGADSELIVPTGHDVQTHHNTEAEIQRILLENLRSSAR